MVLAGVVAWLIAIVGAAWLDAEVPAASDGVEVLSFAVTVACPVVTTVVGVVSPQADRQSPAMIIKMINFECVFVRRNCSLNVVCTIADYAHPVGIS